MEVNIEPARYYTHCAKCGLDLADEYGRPSIEPCPDCGEEHSIEFEACPEHLDPTGDPINVQHHSPEDHIGPDPCRCPIYVEAAL